MNDGLFVSPKHRIFFLPQHERSYDSQLIKYSKRTVDLLL